ncbi:hypothetical protein [Nitrosomonas aestuarii]|nr:hypothetical protein [Nitrosomonas aestuarii]
MKQIPINQGDEWVVLLRAYIDFSDQVLLDALSRHDLQYLIALRLD